MAFHLRDRDLEAPPWEQLQPLLDACFRLPTRDVFARVALAGR